MNLISPKQNRWLRMLALLAMLSGLPASAQPGNPPAITDYASFRLIADRNIFDPNRFPHTGRDRRTSVSRSAPAFALVGTMTYQNGMIAFFDGTDSDYRKVLSVNGTIAGYQVKAITLNGVTLASTNPPVTLAVGAQMRFDGSQWQMAGRSELPATASAETESPAPDQSAPPSSGGAVNDVLKRLMQQREKELK